MEECRQPAFHIQIPNCELKIVSDPQLVESKDAKPGDIIYCKKSAYKCTSAVQNYVVQSQLYFLTSSICTYSEKTTDQLSNTKDGVG